MGYVLSTDINNTYDRQLGSALKSQGSSYAAAQEPYKYNISQAGQTYSPQRQDMYTQNLAAQRMLRERMANFGMSGSGGTAQSAERALSNQFQSALTGSDLEQQAYVDTQNRELAGLAAKNEMSVADITAQNEMARQEALLGQQNTDIQRYLSMFLNNMITREQFRTLTGLEV